MRPALKPYTVIGYYDESGQIFSDHIVARSAMHAFRVVARQRCDAVLVTALDGHIMESEGVHFPGQGVVCAETVLEQPEVFA